MEDPISLKLHDQLDNYSIVFPVTDSGIEMEPMKEIFTFEEILIFTYLTGEPETPASVAETWVDQSKR
jgi:hypothetical protein